MRRLLTLPQEHLSSVISNFLGYEGVGSLSAWLRSKEFADGEFRRAAFDHSSLMTGSMMQVSLSGCPLLMPQEPFTACLKFLCSSRNLGRK